MDQLPHILLIAGSAEAHEIAAALAQTSQRSQAILRRAERSFGPLAVPSQVWTPRTIPEMRNFLQRQGIGVVCDAGHGFDSDVSDIAAAAAAELGLAYARLVRPVWEIRAPALRAASVAEAGAKILPGARVFAATGRGTVADYHPFAGARLFLRQTSRASRSPLPEFAEAVVGKPPFTVAQEIVLFQQLAIDTVICRNVGGDPSRPKLDAALQLGLRAIVIDRPPVPAEAAQLPDANAALAWLADK